MAESGAITPSQFAHALTSLPLSSLALKAAEIRNSIAHLDYSNEQLLPFTQSEPPDADCVDAIKENEVVISRMLERIKLLKTEVEGRGVRWEELSGEGRKEEEVVEAYGRTDAVGEGDAVDSSREEAGQVNGQSRSSPWTDGTFTTGRIVNGEVRMDEIASRGANGDAQRDVDRFATNGVNGTASNGISSTGGRLDDDALRRALEERMRNLGQHDNGDEGMHL